MGRRSKLGDWGLLLACNFTWASQFVLVKEVEDRLGPITTTAAPMLAATLLLLPIVAWHRRRHGGGARVRRADVVAFVALGVFGQVAAQLCVTWGAQLSLASNAAVLTLTLPIATALMAYPLLHERMTGVRWVAFALAIAGVVVSSAGDFAGADLTARGAMVGNALVFVGVLGSAFYNVYGKKVLERFSALEVLLYSYYAACAVLLPLALLAEPSGPRDLLRLPARGWTALGLLAGLQYCFSMVVFLTVLTRLDATQAALSNYLIPVFGVLIAWAVRGERLSWGSGLGGLLVLLSTLLVTVYEARRAARPAAAVVS